MPLARLLAVVMLLSWCATQVLGQSAPASGADHRQLDPDSAGRVSQDRGAPGPANDPAKIRDRVNKFTTEWNSPVDATCYAIRSYVVVRDSPHSDATHRDGSTTCVPAARVRMYSTKDDGR